MYVFEIAKVFCFEIENFTINITIVRDSSKLHYADTEHHFALCLRTSTRVIIKTLSEELVGFPLDRWMLRKRRQPVTSSARRYTANIPATSNSPRTWIPWIWHWPLPTTRLWTRYFKTVCVNITNMSFPTLVFKISNQYVYFSHRNPTLKTGTKTRLPSTSCLMPWALFWPGKTRDTTVRYS